MAEHTVSTDSPIARYLAELRREITWAADAEEILEEILDHLLEAVAMHMRTGLHGSAAEWRALDEFGDPALVSRAFASNTDGGIAVPTTFTRRAGAALIASGLLWLVAIGLMFWSNDLDRIHPWEGPPQTVFMLGALSLMLAGAALTIGVVGLYRRHGGLGGLGQAAIGLAGFTALAGVTAWAWGVWVTPLGVGAVVLAITLRRAGLVPRPATALVGIGGAAAVVTTWAFQLWTGEVALGEGAFTAVLFIALGIYGMGLTMLGSWLRTEEGVENMETRAFA